LALSSIGVSSEELLAEAETGKTNVPKENSNAVATVQAAKDLNFFMLVRPLFYDFIDWDESFMETD